MNLIDKEDENEAVDQKTKMPFLQDISIVSPSQYQTFKMQKTDMDATDDVITDVTFDVSVTKNLSEVQN